MTGSPKQIEWAEKLQSAVIAQLIDRASRTIQRAADAVANGWQPDPLTDEFLWADVAAVELARGRESAASWINLRNNDPILSLSRRQLLAGYGADGRPQEVR